MNRIERRAPARPSMDPNERKRQVSRGRGRPRHERPRALKKPDHIVRAEQIEQDARPRLREIARRMQGLNVYEDWLNGNLNEDGYNDDELAAFEEVERMVDDYLDDVYRRAQPDEDFTREDVAGAMREMYEEELDGLVKEFPELAKEAAPYRNFDHKPQFNEGKRVRLQGYDSRTNWTILRVDKESGTYLVQNADLQYLDDAHQKAGASDMVGAIRQKNREDGTLGGVAISRRGEKVGFELPFEQLEAKLQQ